ncbi:hypothetical protein D1AOALGA4SA_979 [Olavius algarvensis Delta 1 endosymbiont]|nr:hypothetical protein D1AOALGA4SA_979 [Olavius algarvensis Delta 1 endosymbiont]
MASKNPIPEGPALVHPGRLMKVTTTNGRFQVSGVRCQQLKSTRWMGIPHEMDFLSPLVIFSLNPGRIPESGLVFY